MNRTRAALVALLVPLALLASPGAAIATDSTGSLHAYAYSGNGCADPGFVGINFAEGVSWTIEGEAVEVADPSSRFYFPAGFQGEVTGHALPGYSIDERVQSRFFLTVSPSCFEEPTPPSPCVAVEERLAVAEARIERQAERLDRKHARIERLRDRLRSR